MVPSGLAEATEASISAKVRNYTPFFSLENASTIRQWALMSGWVPSNIELEVLKLLTTKYFLEIRNLSQHYHCSVSY